MAHDRYLIVMADDFGIGPGTSAGILDLARRGVVTGSVLLVNSPYAEEAVRSWRIAHTPMELGWHPNLTLDAPVLPREKVPSLAAPDGNFWPLATFVKRLLLGRIAAPEIEAELRAQYRRFRDLVGKPPTIVNAHQHVCLFQPVGYILLDILARQSPLPYLRCVGEPWSTLWAIPGARGKRTLLSFLGKSLAKRQRLLGFPGNDWLAGIANPAQIQQPHFFARWLTRIPGRVVELMCHPGQADDTLAGRDGSAHDGLVQRRLDEFDLLRQPGFADIAANAGFHRVAPGELRRSFFKQVA